MKLIMKCIGMDYYYRAVYESIGTNRKGSLFVNVDGVLHSTTEMGEPDCPVNEKYEIEYSDELPYFFDLCHKTHRALVEYKGKVDRVEFNVIENTGYLLSGKFTISDKTFLLNQGLFKEGGRYGVESSISEVKHD